MLLRQSQHRVQDRDERNVSVFVKVVMHIPVELQLICGSHRTGHRVISHLLTPLASHKSWALHRVHAYAQIVIVPLSHNRGFLPATCPCWNGPLMLMPSTSAMHFGRQIAARRINA